MTLLPATKRILWTSGLVLAGGILMTQTGFAVESALETQTGKIHTFIFDKVAAVVIGGAMALGGGYSVYQGNLMKGLGQLGIGALIGVGLAITKSGGITSVFG